MKLDLDIEGKININVISPKSLAGKRADQVLTSDAFGLITTRNPGSEEDIHRYAALLGKKERTEEEETEFLILKSKLKEKLSTGESEIDQKVENILA